MVVLHVGLPEAESGTYCNLFLTQRGWTLTAVGPGLDPPPRQSRQHKLSLFSVNFLYFGLLPAVFQAVVLFFLYFQLKLRLKKSCSRPGSFTFFLPTILLSADLVLDHGTGTQPWSWLRMNGPHSCPPQFSPPGQEVRQVLNLLCNAYTGNRQA